MCVCVSVHKSMQSICECVNVCVCVSMCVGGSASGRVWRWCEHVCVSVCVFEREEPIVCVCMCMCMLMCMCVWQVVHTRMVCGVDVVLMCVCE